MERSSDRGIGKRARRIVSHCKLHFDIRRDSTRFDESLYSAGQKSPVAGAFCFCHFAPGIGNSSYHFGSSSKVFDPGIGASKTHRLISLLIAALFPVFRRIDLPFSLASLHWLPRSGVTSESDCSCTISNKFQENRKREGARRKPVKIHSLHSGT